MQFFIEIWNKIVAWFTSINWGAWFTENIYPVLITLGSAIVVGLITKVVNNVTKWLKTKIKDEKTLKLVDSLNEIIVDSVNETTQTFVDDLKKSNVFNSEKQQEALQKSLASITEKISKEMKSYIKDTYGDVTEYLTTKIESLIHEEK